MSARLTRRQELRNRQSFPLGMYSGLLTSVVVTLTGVFLRLEPIVILTRAFVSALFLGILVSLGMSIVRLANAEHERRKRLSRQ